VQQELFLRDEVLHMNVITLWKEELTGGLTPQNSTHDADCTILVQCKEIVGERGKEFPRGVTKDTELLGKSTNCFADTSFEAENCFSLEDCEERKSVEHSRETFCERRFGGI